MCKNVSTSSTISVDISLIVSLKESLIINIRVSKSLNGIYVWISVWERVKVNPSESRKIDGNMIANVSECKYWYEFERESE